MKSLKTKFTNMVYTKPEGWDAKTYGECENLYVHLDHENRLIYSYWKPTLKDRIKILLGSPIRLCVNSGTQPPVRLDTDMT